MARCRRANGPSCAGAAAASCRLRRYFAIVGTSVRESTYDASMAKTTASAIGTNRYRATPVTWMSIGAGTPKLRICVTMSADSK